MYACENLPLLVFVLCPAAPFFLTKALTFNPPENKQLSGTEAYKNLESYCRPVVKAIHVGEESTAPSLLADIAKGQGDQLPLAYLLDTKRGAMMGGTGEAFDWDIAAALAQQGLSFFLAGGLDPDSVGRAISEVNPFAVDVSSGVESAPGVKDGPKIVHFIHNTKVSP